MRVPVTRYDKDTTRISIVKKSTSTLRYQTACQKALLSMYLPPAKPNHYVHAASNAYPHEQFQVIRTTQAMLLPKEDSFEKRKKGAEIWRRLSSFQRLRA